MEPIGGVSLCERWLDGGLATPGATLYVGQKEDLKGCVHAMLDRLASHKYFRNCVAMTTLPNWQVNCGYP